jgi:hypothetical protein
MKDLPTLNIWDHNIANAISQGQIKIHAGQWLKCGDQNPKKCRFVRVSKGGLLHVIHWQGSSKSTSKKFFQAINLFKGVK